MINSNSKIFAFVYTMLMSLPVGNCVIPQYIPSIGNINMGRNDLIRTYFQLGFGYSEIVLFLGICHGLRLSLRQLKRILRNLGLGRRRNPSSLEDVCQAIEEELTESGSLIGYRQMTQRLTVLQNLVVDRETVREILNILDPEGVELRSRHRLRRRQYLNKGPNYVWHIDGYDKLKPFGFCIHGAIDGYSRRIMWLEVGSTNNDPSVISQYFIDCVRNMQGTATVIRSDCGTENVYVAAIQRFFRNANEDVMSGENSFRYGRSISNQRIEAWWGILRKGCADWWIKYFKDMRDCGLFSDNNIIHRECLKFCFMHIIREELYKAAKLWNIHRIRPSSNPESPPGRPDALYFLPEASEARDYKINVFLDDIEVAEERCCQRLPENGCEHNFTELAITIMEERHMEMPRNAEDAATLYVLLLEEMHTLIN